MANIVKATTKKEVMSSVHITVCFQMQNGLYNTRVCYKKGVFEFLRLCNDLKIQIEKELKSPNINIYMCSKKKEFKQDSSVKSILMDVDTLFFFNFIHMDSF